MVKVQFELSAMEIFGFFAYAGLEKRRRGEQSMRSSFGAIILIVVGVLFLLSNLGLFPQVWPLLRKWWPVTLIIAGVVMLVEHRGK
jgi:hypothetical protein